MDQLQIKADLHTHTIYSDGAHTTKELLNLAQKKNIKILSLTDHDTVDGIDEAILYGNEIGIEVIPGLEISANVEGKEVHLLGYFINHKNAELKKHLLQFKQERLERAKRILRKLETLGIIIEFSQVKEIANNSPICRPHIAKAMVINNVVDNFNMAFLKYIGDFAPACEKKINLSAESAIKVINDAGGLAFIAHPGKMKESILMNLIDLGIDGIEVVHPSHKKYQQNFYKGIVNQYCLLESGGSDFHGGLRNDDNNFGKFTINSSHVSNIKKMVQNRQSS